MPILKLLAFLTLVLAFFENVYLRFFLNFVFF